MSDAVPPSAGKTFAISSSTTSAAIILLLYTAHKFGVDDLTPEVASAIITLAMGLAGLVMHTIQRNGERHNGAMPQPPQEKPI